MSVAEKSAVEKPAQAPKQQLALTCLVGGWFLLAALLLIFGGLPTLWEIAFPAQVVNEFLSGALLLVVSAGALLGLMYVSLKAEQAVLQRGLRAGVVLAAAFTFVIFWIGFTLAGFLEGRVDQIPGYIIAVGVVVALLFGVYRMYASPGFQAWLVGLEEQGWFHAVAFKPNQGVKVRRGTVMGILTLGLCGIISLVSNRTLGSERFGPNNWYWTVPYSRSATLGLQFRDASGGAVEIVGVDNKVLAEMSVDPNLFKEGDLLQLVKDDLLPTKEAKINNLAELNTYLSKARPNWVTLVLQRNSETVEVYTGVMGLALVIPLMYKVHLVLPVLLAIGLLWLAWRIVSWPTFADFLIATEAEMNKVSWTTRKRLFQDTIVVLVTVFLLTVFLFAVDILWIKVLSNPFIRVLYVDIRTEQLKQQEKTQW